MNKEGTVDDKEGLVLSGTLRNLYAYIRCVEGDIWKNLYRSERETRSEAPGPVQE